MLDCSAAPTPRARRPQPSRAPRYLSAPKGQGLGPSEGPGAGFVHRTHTPFLFTSFFFSPFSLATVASVAAAAAPSSLEVDGPGCSSSMTTIVAVASEAATVAATAAVSGSMALERERGGGRARGRGLLGGGSGCTGKS